MGLRRKHWVFLSSVKESECVWYTGVIWELVNLRQENEESSHKTKSKELQWPWRQTFDLSFMVPILALPVCTSLTTWQTIFTNTFSVPQQHMTEAGWPWVLPLVWGIGTKKAASVCCCLRPCEPLAWVPASLASCRQLESRPWLKNLPTTV